MRRAKKVYSFIRIMPVIFILAGCKQRLMQEKAIVYKEEERKQPVVFVRGDATISCSSLLEKTAYCVNKNEKQESIGLVKSKKKQQTKTTDQKIKKALLYSFIPLGFEIVSSNFDKDVVVIQSVGKQIHEDALEETMQLYSFEMERQGWKSKHVFFDTNGCEWIGFFRKSKDNSFVIRVSRKKKLFFSKSIVFDCKIILLQS